MTQPNLFTPPAIEPAREPPSIEGPELSVAAAMLRWFNAAGLRETVDVERIELTPEVCDVLDSGRCKVNEHGCKLGGQQTPEGEWCRTHCPVFRGLKPDVPGQELRYEPADEPLTVYPDEISQLPPTEGTA